MINSLYGIFTLTFAFYFSYGQQSFAPKYKLSTEILKQYSLDSTSFTAAWELSYIGEYNSALEFWDKEEPKSLPLTSEQKSYFSRYNPIMARDLIIKMAAKEQIIILNEAHHQPYHRIFTKSLLKGLYDEGFRYFGAETIWNMDSVLNNRKYPILNTGGYTQEPCYGDLVREALRIGFIVFSYETTSFQDTTPGNREIQQAKKIKTLLEKNPTAKILIHCGFDHIIESPVPSWGKAMAGRLLEYTGINPLTVDQVKLTEHFSPEFESPYFRIINLNYDAIFIDSVGNIFNGPEGNKQYDIRVYHPRTRIVDGRPHWIFETGRKPFFVNDKIELSYPCLVFAYLDKERLSVEREIDKPIAYDIIELKSEDDKKALSLENGRYTIVVKNGSQEDQCFSVNIH